MTKTANPFADFTKAFGEFKMPMFDMEAVAASSSPLSSSSVQ